MGLDQLLELTSNVAAKALPIVGVIVLIFLVIFVRHLTVSYTHLLAALGWYTKEKVGRKFVYYINS